MAFLFRIELFLFISCWKFSSSNNFIVFVCNARIDFFYIRSNLMYWLHFSLNIFRFVTMRCWYNVHWTSVNDGESFFHFFQRWNKKELICHLRGTCVNSMCMKSCSAAGYAVSQSWCSLISDCFQNQKFRYFCIREKTKAYFNLIQNSTKCKREREMA